MTRMVQVVLAEDVADAGEIQLLVPESALEAARNAIEALTEPDELVSDS